MRSSYPLLLDLTNRLVVVIGGGAVAARKVRGLLDAGATRIRCVAPAFVPEMPQGIERLAQRYQPQHLDGASIVFAATDDPAINAAIVNDARARNLLVNRADADDDQPGDFATPAMLRDGELLITVSAGGNPALAAATRDAIRAALEPHWARMAQAMRVIRPRILAGGWPIEKRKTAFRDLAGPEAMKALETGGIDGLWLWLQQRHGQVI